MIRCHTFFGRVSHLRKWQQALKTRGFWQGVTPVTPKTMTPV